MNRKLKEQHLFEIEIFWNNIKPVTFDQFNAFLNILQIPKFFDW